MLNYGSPEQWHPAANAFPLLSKSDPERFQELVANIRANGLIEPIVLFEDKVLDGRNRLLACKEAGVEPRFEEFHPNGVGPVQWIAAKHTRRDLTASQRAVAALTLLPMLEAEAKERQQATLKKGDALPVTEIFPGRGESRANAAKLTGANSHYVSDAKRIVDADESMRDRIRDNEISLQDAKRELGFKQTLAAINSDDDLRAAIADIEEIPELLDIANSATASLTQPVPQRDDEPCGEVQESQTQRMRRMFEGINSKLVASTLNSGLVSSMGRYDLTLYGLTPVQLKVIREALR